MPTNINLKELMRKKLNKTPSKDEITIESERSNNAIAGGAEVPPRRVL